jgi:hypothetical protein
MPDRAQVTGSLADFHRLLHVSLDRAGGMTLEMGASTRGRPRLC